MAFSERERRRSVAAMISILVRRRAGDRRLRPQIPGNASGLTVVKVRVLSWAPFLPKSVVSLKGGFFDPLTGTQNNSREAMPSAFSLPAFLAFLHG
jgi:hypothetical protein